MKNRYLYLCAVLLLLAGCSAGRNTPPVDRTPLEGIATEEFNTAPQSHDYSNGGEPDAEPSPDPSAPLIPSIPEASGEPYAITKNGLTCLFNPVSGMITAVENAEQRITLDGVLIDTGYNGDYLYSQVGYFDIANLETWSLPKLYMRKKPLPGYSVTGIEETADGINVELYQGGVFILYRYRFAPDGLLLDAELRCTEKDNQEINGVGFLVRGLDYDADRVSYEFPGNTPAGLRSLRDELHYRVTATDYCNGATVLYDGMSADQLNIIFLDNQEKWSTGIYRDENGRVCVVNLAGVLGYVNDTDTLNVGTLFIQLPGARGAYKAVRAYYESLGYAVPVNSVNDGPVYSAHPAGTMDTDFRHLKTLQQFAEGLSALQEMGIRNVWLLPVFLHPDNSVYDTIDQTVIDPRYGGEAGAIAYTAKAHSLDMRVLFDYVPHGPRPQESLAADNPDWCAKTREGDKQIEWGCVSFDYNNPGYAAYTTALVQEHASKLGVDGGRIDCSMGGLPNWFPSPGFRASSSGIAAGINIVRAIREGFIQGGKQPILLPENFHPIPLYAPYTDLFYDMPLYRTMYNLNHQYNEGTIDETEYVNLLQHWLWAERETSVDGLQKLRFLGNHDTSDWTFDAARPQQVYGVEKAKALWALMAFIDGVPMIYQGDETPGDYGLRGEDLTGFFTELFKARAEYLPQHYDIAYIETGKPVFAFHRFGDDTNRLVVINFSGLPQTLEGEGSVLYTSGAVSQDGIVSLEPYGFAILNVEEIN